MLVASDSRTSRSCVRRTVDFSNTVYASVLIQGAALRERLAPMLLHPRMALAPGVPLSMLSCHVVDITAVMSTLLLCHHHLCD